MGILDTIKCPADLKGLDYDDLGTLAGDIRERIISVTSRNGGHIGPNLGVVELTMALHRVFDSPIDPIVFDTSHQGYVHKLLTGRNHEGFDKIRKSGGLSGFLARSESAHDHFGAGHAGTALSAALGMATARDLMGRDNHVVAVVGDASLTCGISLEALNNIAAATKRMVVVLNDNEWSIDKNVGAIATYLNQLITTPLYNRFNEDLESFISHLPGGKSLVKLGSRAKKETKDMIVPSSLFEKLGIRYIGPVDGHQLTQLEQYLEFCKAQDEPVILHVLTRKGCGYEIAENQPEKFHGCSPFDRETGKPVSKTGPSAPKYQDVFGRALLEAARADKRIVGITAAMPSGTGMEHLRDELPEQYFDVGIAEEHGTIFAAGLATQGMRPVCAIYSTFLQRSVDPIIHDICLQNLPVLFAMDRAGLSPNDGPTHHGLFDIAYLRGIPGTVVMQPRDEAELVRMVTTGLAHNGPAFIRYPRGNGTGVEVDPEAPALTIGEAEELRPGDDLMIWALGPWVDEALEMAGELALDGYTVGVTNARFAKPIDRSLLGKQAETVRRFATMEDHVISGGFGSALLEALSDMDSTVPVTRFGWPDRFIDHGSSVDDLREGAGLGRETIMKRLRSVLEQGRAVSDVALAGK